MGKRKPKPPIQTSVDSAVADAFNNIEELRGELESWYENLPESFQNGDKGEALQEAMNGLEGASQPDTPDCIENDTIEFPHMRCKSRAERRDECVAMIRAAEEYARARATELEQLEYKEDGSLDLEDGGLDSDPQTEEERDTLTSELEEFADELNDAAGQWDEVNFPGMYG